MAAWIGVALLSVSWLVGVGYYHPADPLAWTLVTTFGLAFLAADRLVGQGRREHLAAGIAAAVAVAFIPGSDFFPYGAAVAMFALGHLLGGVEAYALAPRRRESIPAVAQIGVNLFERIAHALRIAGTILLVQGVALMGYAAFTSRSHELPAPLAALEGWVAQLLCGTDVAGRHENALALFTPRKTHYLGAVWELFLDPATWCFLAGGIAYLAWRLRTASPASASDATPSAAQTSVGAGPASAAEHTKNAPAAERRTVPKTTKAKKSKHKPASVPPAEAPSVDATPLRWSTVRQTLAALAWFVVPVLLWLPLRSGLMMGLFLNQALLTEYEAPLTAVRVLWDARLHGLLLLVPVLAAWKLATPEPSSAPRPASSAGPLPMRVLAVVAAALGSFLICLGIFWDPAGSRKQGRVTFEEYHPKGDRQWERTDKPFDTQWYGHESGYTYYCIMDYCKRFYDVKRRETPLSEAGLKDTDVLIVKTPTRPFSETEIDAIVDFVQRGGGLMLMGEHTNVFGMGTYLNSIARRFGFAYEYDCLFGIDRVFEQPWRQPMFGHPILQDMPHLQFATSCSIDPRRASGRAVIRSWGLKNKQADYHASNFYPVADDTAEMRYGSFVQLWSMRYGRGRVVAFTDSTQFSNFCVFDPGKKELWMGIVEWLNHASPPVDPRAPLICFGIAFATAGLRASRRWHDGPIVLFAAGVFAWSAAVPTVEYLHRRGMPTAERRPDVDMVNVTIDRSISHCALPRNGFTSPNKIGFGVFERWFLRLGYFTERRTDDVLQGELVVFIRPQKPIDEAFRKAAVDYVRNRGGKLLIVDSAFDPKAPDADASPPSGGNEIVGPREAATANELLQPFGLSIRYDVPLEGEMTGNLGAASVPVQRAAAVEGGTPFAWIQGKPVGATIEVGSKGGSVTVIGFADRFCNTGMGGSADLVPDKTDPTGLLAKVYDWHYRLARRIVTGNPEPPSRPRTDAAAGAGTPDTAKPAVKWEGAMPPETP